MTLVIFYTVKKKCFTLYEQVLKLIIGIKNKSGIKYVEIDVT